MAYMEQTNQLQCAKELDENSVAIILTVSGHIFNGNQKMISYIKKSNAKLLLLLMIKILILVLNQIMLLE